MTGPWPRHVPPAYTPLSMGALSRAALSGLGSGDEELAGFRRLLCARYNATDVLLVDSGTHALDLALRLVVGPAREEATVALPAYTCYDVATAAVGARVPIALYDLDPNTLAPDLDSLARVLSAGARAVVVSSLYGIPVDWEAIERCAAPFGAKVIEDAAQGIGSSWRGKPAGSLGSVSVLSFGRGKGWTGGCGGALLVRNGVTLAAHAELLGGVLPSRMFGGLPGAKLQWIFGRPSLFGLPAALPWLHLGETPYHEPSMARAMPRSAAVLLDRTLALAEHEASIRRDGGGQLRGAISRSDPWRAGTVRLVNPPPDSVAGYLRFPLLVGDGLVGLAGAARARQLGLAGAFPTTLGALGAVRERMVRSGGEAGWPGAGTIVRDLVTLPTHSLVDERERQELMQLVLQPRSSGR